MKRKSNFFKCVIYKFLFKTVENRIKHYRKVIIVGSWVREGLKKEEFLH